MAEAVKRNKVVTPMGVVNFPAVFVPTSMEEGGVKKYSAQIIFSKKTDLTELNKLATEVMTATFGPKAKWPKGYKWPLRDGDEERSEQAAYKKSIFITASSFDQPGVLDCDKQPLLNPKDLYSGCHVRAQVTCYTFDKGGNKGCAFGLQNLWKVKDGTKLNPRQSAEDAFADVSGDELHDLANQSDEEDSDLDI